MFIELSCTLCFSWKRYYCHILPTNYWLHFERRVRSSRLQANKLLVSTYYRLSRSWIIREGSIPQQTFSFFSQIKFAAIVTIKRACTTRPISQEPIIFILRSRSLIQTYQNSKSWKKKENIHAAIKRISLKSFEQFRELKSCSLPGILNYRAQNVEQLFSPKR